MNNNYYLKKFYVENFRNLSQVNIDLGPLINCIVGENGQGKTNLLEAIFFLANKKSFRKNVSFEQLINHNQDNLNFTLKMLLINQNQSEFFSGSFEAGKNQIYKDNKRLKGKPSVQCYVINPFDSFIFHQSGSHRRNWVNQYLSSLFLDYGKQVRKVEKILRNRNILLSQMAYQNNRTNTVLNTKQIKSFDLQLAESAIILARYRKTYCEKLTDLSRQTIKEIFDQESKLIFDYQPSFNTTSSQAFISQLENNTQQDIMSKTTSLGPHRDEFYLYFNNSKTNDCGSTGQQKMSYLSLVFSHFELCFEKLGVHPIVLIDDISGELDSLRWKNLIEYLKKKSFQVVITTANDAFRKELTHSNESKLFSVTEGIVEEVKSSLKDSHIGA